MWKSYRQHLCANLPDGLVDVMFSDGDIRTAKNVNWYTPYKSCGNQRIFIIAWRESE
jgi:hypothetical protein